MKRIVIVVVLCVIAYLAGYVIAVNAQAAQQPAPTQLMEELARARALILQLQSKPNAADFERTFTEARADAANACRSVRGKLWVMISYQGTARTVSVSCELPK